MKHIVPPTVVGNKILAFDKLAKLCGLFGSDHLGERAAAAQMADKIVREHGLTWSAVISPPPKAISTSSASVEEQIDFALNHEDMLNAWEWGFLNGIRGRQFLTDKQLAKLGKIVAKVSEYRRAA